MAMDGRLVTNEGYPVLSAQPGGLAAALPGSNLQPSQGGQPTQGGVAAGVGAEAGRFINLRDKTPHININETGEIYAGDERVAQLNVVEFGDQRMLRKIGGSLYENKDPQNTMSQGKGTIVRQGVIETSNVNPIEEMTRLIQANRLFEHDLKAMKTYGELMGREANDIGKL